MCLWHNVDEYASGKRASCAIPQQEPVFADDSGSMKYEDENIWRRMCCEVQQKSRRDGSGRSMLLTLNIKAHDRVSCGRM